MEDINIKVLEEVDLSEKEKAEVEALNRHFFPDNLINDKYIFGRKERDPRRVLIENMDGEVLGNLLFVEREVAVNKNWLKVFYVGEIMVREDQQGKGLGKKLIENFIKSAEKMKFDAGLLICAPDKEGFYLKSGLRKFNEDISIVLSDGDNGQRLAEGIIMGITFSEIGKKYLSGGVMVNLGLPV